MKINKQVNGIVVITNSNDEIIHIIATDVFVGRHERNEFGVLISKTASSQKESEAIVIYSNKVTEVNGIAFKGTTRNDLLVLLATVF